jgi:hypothetical protein
MHINVRVCICDHVLVRIFEFRISQCKHIYVGACGPTTRPVRPSKKKKPPPTGQMSTSALPPASLPVCLVCSAAKLMLKILQTLQRCNHLVVLEHVGIILWSVREDVAL